MSVPFIKRIWQKPPIAFPLIGLFHVGILGYILYDNISDPIGGLIWMQPISMLVYTVLWLLICDLKKWAALGYMGVTTANLIARMLITDHMVEVYFLNVLFPADVIFTIITLIYYKKFE
jgi:glycerol-3-phosphate acyltransferase PlsY